MTRACVVCGGDSPHLCGHELAVRVRDLEVGDRVRPMNGHRGAPWGTVTFADEKVVHVALDEGMDAGRVLAWQRGPGAVVRAR